MSKVLSRVCLVLKTQQGRILVTVRKEPSEKLVACPRSRETFILTHMFYLNVLLKKIKKQMREARKWRKCRCSVAEEARVEGKSCCGSVKSEPPVSALL